MFKISRNTITLKIKYRLVFSIATIVVTTVILTAIDFKSTTVDLIRIAAWLILVADSLKCIYQIFKAPAVTPLTYNYASKIPQTKTSVLDESISFFKTILILVSLPMSAILASFSVYLLIQMFFSGEGSTLILFAPFILLMAIIGVFGFIGGLFALFKKKNN